MQNCNYEFIVNKNYYLLLAYSLSYSFGMRNSRKSVRNFPSVRKKIIFKYLSSTDLLYVVIKWLY